MFDIFESRYIFKGTVILGSGLHIGGGKLSSVTGSDNPVLKNFDGSPLIPGSSMKGVIRSNLESILRSMSKNLWSCDIVSGPECIKKEKDGSLKTLRPSQILTKTNKEKLVEDELLEQIIFDSACTICRLFGSPFLGSKVYFKDLQLKCDHDGEPEAFSQIEVRDFVAIDRDTGTAKHQGKFDAEIVPAGTRFDLEIVVENPEMHELGLLLLGFDLFSEGHARIGGLTSRGLGRIKIDLETVKKMTKDSFLNKGGEQVDINALKEEALSALRENTVNNKEEADHAQANV